MSGHRHVALRFESKLILYALVVLMLPLALAAFLVHENIAAAKRETMGTALASARGIAGSVDAFLARHDQTLVALSRAPAISSPDRLVAERVLARAIRQQTSFRWIALAGSDGVMRTYAAGLELSVVPANVASLGWFRSLLSDQQPVFAPATPDQAGTSEIIIAVPVYGEAGTITQVLIAQVSLRTLVPTLLSFADQDRAAVLIADRNGVPLIQTGWPPHLTENGMAGLPPIRGALANRTGTLDYRDEVDGSFWLAGFTSLSTTHWAVAVASPAEVAAGLPGDLTPEGVLILLGVLVAALALAVVLSRQITRPLRTLTSQAVTAALGTGEARQPVLHSGDEIQQLAAVLAELSNGLLRNTDALARSREQIAHQTDQIREVLTRLTHTQEDERRRIAADVHDGVSQLIVGARFEIFASRRALSRGRHDLAETRLGRSQELLDEAVSELHRVVFDLRPKTLEELGLVKALERYIQFLRDEEGDTHWRLETVGEPRSLAPHVELVIFRTIQEGLNNARRHASASEISVGLRFSAATDEVVATVADDGIGFRPEDRELGQMSQLGLLAMRDRAASIDATLTIQARKPGGTEIVLRVPNRPYDDMLSADAAQPISMPGQRAS